MKIFWDHAGARGQNGWNTLYAEESPIGGAALQVPSLRGRDLLRQTNG
jgi:hypothetical protein